MFRPIRKDTPKGKAAQTLQSGQCFVFILTPLFAFDYGQRIMENGGFTQHTSEHASAVLPPIVLIPTVTLLIGLAFLYDGWWHLRKLS